MVSDLPLLIYSAHKLNFTESSLVVSFRLNWLNVHIGLSSHQLHRTLCAFLTI